MFLIQLLACSEHSFVKEGVPNLSISPSYYDFGGLSYQELPESMLFTAKNIGTGKFYADNVVLEQNTVFRFYNFPEELSPDESVEFEVTFDPEENAEYSDTLSVNYEGESRNYVFLDGTGLAQKISVTTDSNYLEDNVLCPLSQDIVISNVGTYDLSIYDLSIFTSFPSDISIDLSEIPEYPFIIAPGEEKSISVNSSNQDFVVDELNIEVESNDPTNPVVESEILFSPIAGVWTQDSYEQTVADFVDVLFVVDNSGSMYNEQTNLASNFQGFVGSLLFYNVDFQIGFITTDSTDLRGPILNNNTPNIESEFSLQAMVGTNGSSIERPLEMAYRATGGPGTGSGTALDLIRADSTLSIVLITDERDSSDGDNATYLNHFSSFANNGTRVHSIISPPPNGCSGMAINDRLAYFSTQTSGSIMSICSEDWGADLQSVAMNAALNLDFPLTDDPVPATITVTVDNQPETNWTYNVNTNSVVFNPSNTPLPGQEVIIDYAIAADCN